MDMHHYLAIVRYFAYICMSDSNSLRPGCHILGETDVNLRGIAERARPDRWIHGERA